MDECPRHCLGGEGRTGAALQAPLAIVHGEASCLLLHGEASDSAPPAALPGALPVALGPAALGPAAEEDGAAGAAGREAGEGAMACAFSFSGSRPSPCFSSSSSDSDRSISTSSPSRKARSDASSGSSRMLSSCSSRLGPRCEAAGAAAGAAAASATGAAAAGGAARGAARGAVAAAGGAAGGAARGAARGAVSERALERARLDGAPCSSSLRLASFWSSKRGMWQAGRAAPASCVRKIPRRRRGGSSATQSPFCRTARAPLPKRCHSRGL